VTLPRLVLYHRPECHLCHEMEAALRQLAPTLGFTLDLVNVDGATELRDRYGALVPLLSGPGSEICRYILDEAALRRRLSDPINTES